MAFIFDLQRDDMWKMEIKQESNEGNIVMYLIKKKIFLIS